MHSKEFIMAKKKYYFMAGLPRSGSTMLSAILNQNPRFYSGPSSPVVATMLTLEQTLSRDELFLAFPKREFATNIITSVIDQYYADTDKPVIFEKNRSWVNRMHYIHGYFGIEHPKVIYPVRDVSEILTSFLSMIRRNPGIVNERLNFIDQSLVQQGIPLNDENRCRAIAGGGILGQSFDGLKKALSEGYRANIHFVEYRDLVEKPKETMEKLYKFINEPYYNHDFKNLKNIHQENDAQIYGFEDMHAVRQSVKSVSALPEDVLPMSILENVKGAEFWREIDDVPLSEENEAKPKAAESFFGEVINTTEESDNRFI
jgi:sulfotransferase